MAMTVTMLLWFMLAALSGAPLCEGKISLTATPGSLQELAKRVYPLGGGGGPNPFPHGSAETHRKTVPSQFSKEQQRDNTSLSKGHIMKEETALQIALLDVRGGEQAQPEFVDVTRAYTLVHHDWNANAPEWYSACPGLSIEGVCDNLKCKALNCWFIENLGFGDFQLEDAYAVCPMCHHRTAAIVPGFSNCLWKVVAVKNDSSREFRRGAVLLVAIVAFVFGWSNGLVFILALGFYNYLHGKVHLGLSQTIHYGTTKDYYITFDEQEAGMASFSNLQIIVRKLPDRRACGIPIPARRPMIYQHNEVQRSAKQHDNETDSEEHDHHMIAPPMFQIGLQTQLTGADSNAIARTNP